MEKGISFGDYPTLHDDYPGVEVLDPNGRPIVIHTKRFYSIIHAQRWIEESHRYWEKKGMSMRLADQTHKMEEIYG